MTPIRPEERNKAILLIVAIIAVFGFGAYRLLGLGGGGGAAAPPTTTPVASAPATGPLAPPPAPGGAVGPPGQITPQPILPPPASQNPFRRVLSPDGAPPPSTSSAPPPKSGTGAMSVKEARNPRPAPQGASQPSFPSFTPGDGGMTGRAPVPPPEARSMELVGVVFGATSIAMIRTEGREHFVRVGDRVGGYKVAAISTDVVTLRRGDQTRTLRVGFPQDGPATGIPATAGSGSGGSVPPMGVAPSSALPAPAASPEGRPDRSVAQESPSPPPAIVAPDNAEAALPPLEPVSPPVEVVSQLPPAPLLEPEPDAAGEPL